MLKIHTIPDWFLKSRRTTYILAGSSWGYASFWAISPLLGWSSYVPESFGTSCRWVFVVVIIVIMVASWNQRKDISAQFQVDSYNILCWKLKLPFRNFILNKLFIHFLQYKLGWALSSWYCIHKLDDIRMLRFAYCHYGVLLLQSESEIRLCAQILAI